IGPAASFPTSTSPNVGSQSTWGLGPSADAVAQAHPWVIGVLANNLWSTAGDSSNQMLLQYFINYNMKKGWYLTSAPIITANWKATSGNVWTVPCGGGFGRIMKLGFQPVNLQLEFFGNAAHPAGTSPWSMRAQIAFLFPKLTKEEEKMLLEKKLKQLEQPPEKK